MHDFQAKNRLFFKLKVNIWEIQSFHLATVGAVELGVADLETFKIKFTE